MQIILLKKIPNLGNKNEIKNVSLGYARNFLLPKKLAQIATSQTIAQIQIQTKKQKLNTQKKESSQAGLSTQIAGKTFVIKKKTTEGNNLYAGIDSKEIAQTIIAKLKLPEAKKIIFSKNILLDKKIKKIGEYEVQVKIGEDKININLKVETDANRTQIKQI